MTRDQAQDVVDRWAQLRPELDLGGMAVLARVKRLSRVLLQLQREVFDRHELQPGDVDVLSPLYRAGGGLRPRELRSAMLVGSGTLTPRLDRLEAAGLLERRPDPDDRRGRLLHLTAEGERRLPAVVEELLEVENTILAVLPPQERDRLAASLATLLAAAEGDAS